MKQSGIWKCADDYDQPPPENKSLGMEGEIPSGEWRSDYAGITSLAQPEELKITTQNITTVNGITINTKDPYLIIRGSSTTETTDYFLS